MNRRTALARCAAIAGVGSVGTAGCLGALDRDDGDESASDDDGATEPADGTDAAAGGHGLDEIGRWLASPDSDEPGHVFVTAWAPAAIFEQGDDVPEEVRNELESSILDGPIDGPAPTDVTAEFAASFGVSRSVAVVRGDVDAAAAATALEADGVGSAGSRGEFDLYGDGATAWGISPEAIVEASWPADPVSAVERAVDARAGEVARIVDERATLSQLATALPAGHVLFAETVERSADAILPTNGDEAVDAFGESYDVRGAETRVTNAVVFADAADATEAFLREILEDAPAAVDPSDATVEIDGAVGLVAVTMPTADLS